MKGQSSLIIALVSILILFGCRENVYEIYLSPDGDDTANGELSTPIASLEHAAKLVRENAGKIPITINLSGGVYRLQEPLKFTAADGGTAEAPVKWQALPGEKPVISGGILVSNWKLENNNIWSASLPKNYKGKFRSFYVNNKRAVRARFPDKDYLRVDKAGEDDRTNFFFKKNELPKVKEESKLELIIMHDWSITRVGVKSIDWRRNHLITSDSIGAGVLSFFTITNWEEHPRYYLENAIEFCDRPGEWYCDYLERKIYYYPFPNENISETRGVIPIAKKLITITGSNDRKAGFISFSGITFEHTAWQLPSKGYCGIQACMFDNRGVEGNGWNKVPAAIEVDIADNCKFYDCIIRHTGGSGIWLRENCSNCEISKSHIYDISGNGVNIGEGRDRLINATPWWQLKPEEVSKNNKISRSLIEDCGKQFFGAIGIWGGLVANTIIDNNEVRNLPYTGISIGWMWNKTPTPCSENSITNNHIHNVMKVLSDGGGIYCLGLQPNSIITNNLIHDVSVNAGSAESNGMFLDEGIKDLLVENNIVYNIARSPLRFHKAFQNTVKNNVFVCGDNIPPIRYNRTKEEDISKIDNLVLSQSSSEDMETLDSIVTKRISIIGPGKDF